MGAPVVRDDLEQVDLLFEQFHAVFARFFGNTRAQRRSRQYLQGLLVQDAERGNAENLAEAVDGATPRTLQRFLTEAPWDDVALLQELQRYLAPGLTHPEAVWCVDGSDFPKQGRKSVGVARQYCGALGKVASCQAGVFLAYSGPRGRALVDRRLFLPAEWTHDPERCRAAGVPENALTFQSKTDLALRMLARTREAGHLVAAWVTADDAFGQSPSFRDGLVAQGWRYVLDVPAYLTVWPTEVRWSTPEYGGMGRPKKRRPEPDQRATVAERRRALAPEAWAVLTVAEGGQGPRTYRFACERVRESRDREPGKVLWLLHKENLDGGEPRSFLSNASEDTSLAELARVAMSRWPIETEFEEDKSLIAPDEYEVRSWAGWHHHQTMCFLAAAFLLTLQQEWGEKGALAPPADAAAGISPGGGLASAPALQQWRSACLAHRDAEAQRSRQTQPRPAAGT